MEEAVRDKQDADTQKARWWMQRQGNGFRMDASMTRKGRDKDTPQGIALGLWSSRRLQIFMWCHKTIVASGFGRSEKCLAAREDLWAIFL